MGLKDTQRVVPALRVASYAASKPFYEALGFREEWTHHFAPGLPTFASMILDGMEIFLSEHSGDCQPGGLVHFYVPDVDALYDDFLEYGVKVEQAPNNDLGADLRVMSVLDPDNNRLKFLTQTHWE
ncbi:glyoxalase superfamily protein [Pseudoduganella sp. S-14]|jgi:catechol 2,3-dioxygenase-like lactoylglutathione lyase family enzyme|uniref:glyoxalase superfamily protein n=1 Tax=Pseudoduganella sp. S-14 TaxID=3404065 RepID=UPI003CEFDB95